MSHYSISYSDVSRHKNCTEETFKDRDALNKILQEMGMEVDKGYEAPFCQHRSPITDIVVTGRIYQGQERTDEAWKKIKYMLNSLELYGHTCGNYLDA